MTSVVGGTLCALLVLGLVGREALELGAPGDRVATRRAVDVSIGVLGAAFAVAVMVQVARLV